MNNILKILIADDSRLMRAILNKIVEELGYSAILAKDGVEAVKLFKLHSPDLVILDIVMPIMDGITAGKIIKNEIKDNYIPIIFITGNDKEETLINCIEVGADDFMYKPFNVTVLSAKIKSLLYVKKLLKIQLLQKKKLLEYHEKSIEEEEIAANLYKNIIHTGFFEIPELKYMLSPMALFNGDILLTAKTPANQLYVLLGDFTGHGLSASVAAGTVAEQFYSLAEKGYTIDEIIIEINAKMYEVLPTNKFLAATILALYEETGMLNVITCGLPDHYLYNKKTKELVTILSNNLPLGILSSFKPESQFFEITEDSYLYLLSDGVIESENKQGQQFDVTGVIEHLQTSSSGYDNILMGLDMHLDGLPQQDDITLVELHCNVINAKWLTQTDVQKKMSMPALEWSSYFEFKGSSLREVYPVPVIVQAIIEIQDLFIYREPIFLVVTELYSNALEHGILQLNSNVKKRPDGFIAYYNQREKLLAQLNEGWIKISFSHIEMTNGGKLTIDVQDSGPGFNYKETCEDSHKHKEIKTFGRGIKLLNSLCSSLEYRDGGSSVSVVYEWNNNVI